MIEVTWTTLGLVCCPWIIIALLVLTYALCRISKDSDNLQIKQDFLDERLNQIKREADETNRSRSK